MRYVLTQSDNFRQCARIVALLSKTGFGREGMTTKTSHGIWRALAQPGGKLVTVITCLLGAAAFAAIASVSLEFTRLDSRIAAVWVPNAVAVAFLMRFTVPREQWFILALWAGNIGANLAAGDPLGTAAALAACNAIEIQVAVALARQWCGPRPDMQDFAHLARFIAAAAVIAPMTSATLAMITIVDHPWGPLAAWAKWAVTDGLGMAILAPGILVLIDAARTHRQFSRRRAAEWIVVVSAGALATTAIFMQSAMPILFLSGPIVAFHAFRLGAAGTAIAVGVTAAIAISFTSMGLGPITLLEGSSTLRLIVLQVYLAAAFLLGLPVAATLAGRDRALDQLAEKQSELSLLADSISDAVLQFDRSGQCVYASRSSLAVLGERPAALIGQRMTEQAHPESRAHLEDIEDSMLDGRSMGERITYRRKRDDVEGRSVFIEANFAVVRENGNGRIAGIAASLREVTERVELEMQLTRARRLAENAARGKSEFLANMSHEIRTPMNGVLGFAELLMQADLPPEQKHQAELIVQSGRSMMMLLNDILDLAKIEAGQIVMNHEAVDLANLVSECIALHQASAANKGLRLAVEQHASSPSIITDSLRLRQILLNLLSNAVKFTVSGTITVRHCVTDDQVIISVEDTGIGILPDRIANIFQPFEQGENNIARRYGGTGLGLAISRQLAELLGGYLDVESQPGKGSRFSLGIPLVRAPEDHSLVLPKSEMAAPAPQLQPSRILLAEDHDVNRMLVTAMLERCGQHVTVARDGEQAVEAVLEAFAQGHPFDLVLMDIQMPGCDGYSAARAIRSEGIRASRLPIVALTANAYPEDIAAAREAGMQGHLSKPLAFADLVKALQRWLPVRIIDEFEAKSGEEGRVATQPTVHSPDLLGRWKERRREALDAVSAALREEGLTGRKADDLAKLVHKLAGTAGMFGEEELGERAAAFERALRSEVKTEVRRKLAQELLDEASDGLASGS